MALTCSAPECEEEFSYEETEDGYETGKPIFSHMYVADDALGGVVTSYVCSRGCMRDYLDDLDDEEEGE